MKNIIGKKFNYLTVVSFSHKDKFRHVFWNVKCDCGKLKKVMGGKLKANLTKSCGCYHKKIAKEVNTTHGMGYSRFYKIWEAMKWRCSSKNSQHKNYFDIGIRVCKRWNIFENFKSDMLDSYNKHCKEFSEKDTSIDRINPFKSYNLLNCRWATRKIQNSNQRRYYVNNK